ncbi:DUF2877 domain-containing protein [Ornithinibacillus bavariensis]|uniref:DUF2877 domain-containing protein n=1 Tax=Ornithinibacillus bavariensis TaxID=545502 RepID=A0A920C864_9BACI|nr:DUF2877 domain-containing protein [Ornithinibacillus bavariensis]GIO28348.1 hypothetical protein J43TS3_29590 [Ornithinibacillus bavariensis]
MNKTFYIEEYAKNIPLFLSENKTGHVHSVFSNGLNIRFGERLLYIGTTKNGRLPFGAHISKMVCGQVLQDIDSQYPVVWNQKDRTISFNNGTITLSFENAIVYENSIRISGEIDTMSKSIETLLISLLKYDAMTGLDVPIESFVLDYLQGKTASEALDNPLYIQLTKLSDSLFIEDKEACITALRYFLGRGKGLTPSGDDHIVGLLAVQGACHSFTSTLNEAVLSLMEHESITTDVAKEYLYYAANGQFSSTVISVIEHLIENIDELPTKLEDLLAVGHSSGVDTIFGILFGLLAWRRKSICQKK